MTNFETNLPTSNSGFLPDFAVNNINVLPILKYLLLIDLGVVGIVTIILYYHWRKYSYGNKTVIFAQVLYTVVLVLALGAMLNAYFNYA